MELLNELLEKQIDNLNYNRNHLVESISEADENSPNYEKKINKITAQIAITDERIDYLMGKIVSSVQVETKEGIQNIKLSNETGVDEFLRETREK